MNEQRLALLLAAQNRRLHQIRYQRYLKSSHWRTFRLGVIAGRGPYCQRCRSPKKIQVHHLSYERLGRELPDDVAVLCESCHQRAHDIYQPKHPAGFRRIKQFKVTQAFTKEQRISGSLDENPPSSPGNR